MKSKIFQLERFKKRPRAGVRIVAYATAFIIDVMLHRAQSINMKRLKKTRICSVLYEHLFHSRTYTCPYTTICKYAFALNSRDSERLREMEKYY